MLCLVRLPLRPRPCRLVADDKLLVIRNFGLRLSNCVIIRGLPFHLGGYLPVHLTVVLGHNRLSDLRTFIVHILFTHFSTSFCAASIYSYIHHGLIHLSLPFCVVIVN